MVSGQAGSGNYNIKRIFEAPKFNRHVFAIIQPHISHLLQREVVAAAQEAHERIASVMLLETEQRQIHEVELERVFDWADSFEQVAHERKCMILAVLIDKVLVYRNGKVKLNSAFPRSSFLIWWIQRIIGCPK